MKVLRRRSAHWGTSALALAALALSSMVTTAAAQESCSHARCSGPPPANKGTNYIVGTAAARLSELQFISHDNTTLNAASDTVEIGGTYHSNLIAQEIHDLREDFGVERIRAFGSFWGWLLDPDDYTSNLADFAAICSQEGMELMFTPWSTTNEYPSELINPFFSLYRVLPASADPGDAHFDIELYTAIEDARAFLDTTTSGFLGGDDCLDGFDEPWQMSWRSEPGNNYFHTKATNDDTIVCIDCPPPLSCTACTVVTNSDEWPAWYEQKFEQYVAETAEAFRSNMTTPMVFDLMNEPEAIRDQAPGADLTPLELIQLDKVVRTFLEMTYDEIVGVYDTAGTPRPGITVGYARTATLEDDLLYLYSGPSAVRLSIVSFHSYEDPDPFHAEILEAEAAVTALETAYPNEPELPLWCTEFFAAYFPLPTVHTSPGSLPGLLHELTVHSVEGFVWNSLSSNLLFQDLNSACANPMFPDGFHRPIIEDANGIPVTSELDIWELTNTIEFLPTPGVVLTDMNAYVNW